MSVKENVFSQLYSCHMDLYFCGERRRTVGHEFGPSTRNHFLITYVTEGEAILYMSDGNHRFGRGDVLITFPGVSVHYKAIGNWSIKWVGVGSADLGMFLAKLGVSAKEPIVPLSSGARFEEILDEILAMPLSPYPSQGMKLGRLLCELVEQIAAERESRLDPPTIRSNEILRYIAAHYTEDIRVGEIAEHYHLDRSYLERSFKRETGRSMRDVISGFRIRRAQTLLRETGYSVEEVAKRAGFRDRLYFSRFFREKFGMTPTEYRRASREGDDRLQFDVLE